MEYSRRAERRGRGIRGPILPPEVPRWTSRPAEFDQAVLDAYAPIHEQWSDELDHLDIALDTVPRMRSRHITSEWPDEVVADGAVPLGRLIPAGVDDDGRPTRPRIVVFRRPIEMRTHNVAERSDLLHYIIVKLVATYLNVETRTIDPEVE
ncbi:metallopeptidase family protein [Corynebacterium kroppenstedtii]|uniref:metallopeptidase family protein n=1 Tax=Corynebacterium sp. PCR 32 TaxID=3351342 RepID=UPI003095D582